MNILIQTINETLSSKNSTLGIFVEQKKYSNLIDYIYNHISNFEGRITKTGVILCRDSCKIEIIPLYEGQQFRGRRYTKIICDRFFSEQYIREVLEPMSPNNAIHLHLDILLSNFTYN